MSILYSAIIGGIVGTVFGSFNLIVETVISTIEMILDSIKNSTIYVRMATKFARSNVFFVVVKEGGVKSVNRSYL